MKRVIVILIMAITMAGGLFAQTEWQGRVARGGSQDFPSEGYYAASNSFARNSIVTVNNPATGKSVRVVISRGLSDNSLFMTLSNDAARALGLDGSFPATMTAQPVIIPGVSDQSIGSEMPFTRDPDINPSASAGDPNAFVFNSQTTPQDIRPQRNDGQAASTDTSTILQPANTQRVDTVSDVDLNQSSLISDNAKLPTDLNNQNARSAGSEPPTNQKQPDATALNTLQSADTRQVAASDQPEKLPDTALNGQAAALADTSPAPARSATPSSADNLGANQAAPVQEATINPNSGIAQGMRNAIDAPVDTQKIAPTQSGAVSRGVASSLKNLRPDQNGGDTASAATAKAPTQRGGVMAGAVEKLGQQGLGQTQQPRNQGQSVTIPEARGVGAGMKSMDSLRDRPNTGDIARPDHLFAPVDGQSASKSTEPNIALPMAKDAGSQSLATAAAKGDSLLDKQMAAIAARNGHRQLFTAAKQEGDQALLPSISAKSVPLRETDLPLASIKKAGATDPSLAGQDAGNGKTVDGKLPVANKVDDGKADPSLPGIKGTQSGNPNANMPLAKSGENGNADPSLNGPRTGIAAGFKGNLPSATVKGDEKPEFSNPYLEGDKVATGDATLPLAQLVPGEIPQATLQGAGPGLALVPEKSDLPMVALDVTQKAQPAFSALNPTQQSIANAKLPSPNSGANALPEDPVNALRPAQTVVSLEPADYKPPQIPAPNSDRILAEAPQSADLSSNLAEIRVKAGLGPDVSINGQKAGPSSPINADLAAARDPSLPEGAIGMQAPGHVGLGDMNLATAGDPKGLNSDAMLQAMRPQENAGSVSLATPRDRSIPDLFKPGSTPADAAVQNPDLTQAKTPNYLSKEPSLAGVKGPNDIDNNAVSVANPKSPNAENLLPGTKPAPGDNGPIAINPVRPGLPNQVKNQNNPPLTQNDQGKNTAKQPDKQTDKQVDNSVVVDDQWAQKNLPLVKNLQKEKYYLQVGAFANARSAKSALGDIAPKFPVAVVPEKGSNKSVYKVFIGPLNEDEKGLMLYIFRAKGYRDAFIKKTQP